MNTLILKLDVAGRPIDWLTPEQGATLYCREQVAWEAGESKIVLHGGVSRLTGERSILELNTIVAARALDRRTQDVANVPALTNKHLFRRDQNMCLYCGECLPIRSLTRDHLIPLSKGGKDTWMNVVTACRSCNQRKGNLDIDQFGMRLLAVPYVPNRAEGLILANRWILADQMAFLHSRVGRDSRLRDSLGDSVGDSLGDGPGAGLKDSLE